MKHFFLLQAKMYLSSAINANMSTTSRQQLNPTNSISIMTVKFNLYQTRQPNAFFAKQSFFSA